jgi:hypothetical protein
VFEWSYECIVQREQDAKIPSGYTLRFI